MSYSIESTLLEITITITSPKVQVTNQFYARKINHDLRQGYGQTCPSSCGTHGSHRSW